MWSRPSKKTVKFSPPTAEGEQQAFLKLHMSPPRSMFRNSRWRKDVKPTWSAEFFHGLGSKASRVLRCISLSTRRSSVNKVSSSSSAKLMRSRSMVDHEAMMYSHRVEAVEDCIEFLNSSTSLQRSNSVSAGC